MIILGKVRPLSRPHPEAHPQVLIIAPYGVGGLFEILRRWIDGQLNLSTEMLIEHGAGFLGSLGLYTLGQAPDQAAPRLAAVDETR